MLRSNRALCALAHYTGVKLVKLFLEHPMNTGAQANMPRTYFTQLRN